MLLASRTPITLAFTGRMVANVWETSSGPDVVQCQQCGARASAARTMCPSCGRRMGPSGERENLLPPALQEMLAGAAAPATTHSTPSVPPYSEQDWSPPPSQLGSDFAAALRTVQRAPWLVVVTVALGKAPAAIPSTTHHRTAGWAVLLLPLILFEIGFSGTQRVWLLRTWRQIPLSLGDCWTLSWRFFGRLFRLGLLVYWPLVILIIPAGLVAHAEHATWVVAVFVAVTNLLLDTLLTFVVPELVFGPASAVDAWRSGRHLLRVSWPACRWYVLTPGLCLIAIGNSLGRIETQRWVAAIAAGLAALVALAMKGAILSSYVRLRPAMASINY